MAVTLSALSNKVRYPALGRRGKQDDFHSLCMGTDFHWTNGKEKVVWYLKRRL